MTEHRLLTGDALHEPKGVETATADQVYAADGVGSGTWKARLDGVVNLNRFTASGRIADLSVSGSNTFVYVAQKSKLTRVSGAISGTISGSNATITIYRNSIAQTPTISIPTTGSGPGVTFNVLVNPNINLNDGDVLEFRVTTATTGSVSAHLNATLLAVI